MIEPQRARRSAEKSNGIVLTAEDAEARGEKQRFWPLSSAYLCVLCGSFFFPQTLQVLPGGPERHVVAEQTGAPGDEEGSVHQPGAILRIAALRGLAKQSAGGRIEREGRRSEVEHTPIIRAGDR